MAMSAARPGAAAGSVRSASRAISVSTMMFFFSTVTSSVSACAKATTTCGWPAAMVRLRVRASEGQAVGGARERERRRLQPAGRAGKQRGCSDPLCWLRFSAGGTGGFASLDWASRQGGAGLQRPALTCGRAGGPWVRAAGGAGTRVSERKSFAAPAGCLGCV